MRTMDVRALGGGPLEGEKLVRIAYVDEAGIGKEDHEPHLVVAAVIVHGDTECKPLEKELLAIKSAAYSGKRLPPGFILHATELFSGGKVLSRDEWPKEIRWQILDRVLALPAKYNLPVAYGHVRKANFFPVAAKSESKKVRRERVMAAHAVAFTVCAAMVDQTLRVNWPDEVVSIVAEDNTESRSLIKDVMKRYQEPDAMKSLGLKEDNFFPFTHIHDPVHFSEKSGSSLLQLADACCFAIKRRLMKTPECDRFFGPISDQLSSRLKDDL